MEIRFTVWSLFWFTMAIFFGIQCAANSTIEGECPTNGTCYSNVKQIYTFVPNAENCTQYTYDCKLQKVMNESLAVPVANQRVNFCAGDERMSAIFFVALAILALTHFGDNTFHHNTRPPNRRPCNTWSYLE